MDSENYRDLAEKAWELYKLLAAMQRALSWLFVNEFIDLCGKEFEKENEEYSDLPF